MRHIKNILILVCLVGLPIVAFWMGGRIFELRKVSDHFRSKGRLSQLRQALLNYHDQHGAFPPIKYQPTSNGPIHSWRVLLVPYTDVEYAQRFAHYDFSEEWNSEKNLRALADMPYFCYFSMKEDNRIANYLAIGEGDDWPSNAPLNALLVTKGKDRFLLVELPDSDIHWMEPKY